MEGEIVHPTSRKGVKVIRFSVARRRDGSPPRGIAIGTIPGLERYEQNAVLKVHRHAVEVAMDFDGVAIPHFPSLEDRRLHGTLTPEGRRIISDDLRQFVLRAEALPSTEYIVVDRPVN